MRLRYFALAAAFVLVACQKKPDPPGAAPAVATPSAPAPSSGSDVVERVVVPAVLIAEHGSTQVHVAWRLPEGTGVNDGGPFRVSWTSSEGLSHAPEEMHTKGAQVAHGFDVVVQPNEGVPSATLAGNVSVVVCDIATHAVCVPVQRRIEMTFMAEGKANVPATVTVPLPPAKVL